MRRRESAPLGATRRNSAQFCAIREFSAILEALAPYYRYQSLISLFGVVSYCSGYYSFGLRSSPEAEGVMQGWVQEMWGYSIAAASVGIQHTLVRKFQVEHGASARPAEDFFKLCKGAGFLYRSSPGTVLLVPPRLVPPRSGHREKLNRRHNVAGGRR